ncbi:MAG TPA: VanZ family protein [Gemmatimonadales bacterium]|nr:VanZ family protein [Gemmatimonadales bacterium]
MADLAGRRLGWLLLVWLGLVVAAIVLAPFTFVPALLRTATWEPLAATELRDVVLNIILFVPLGFLLERVQGGRWTVIRIMVVGLLTSLLIESAQLMLPGRYSALSDILANGVGAGVGALVSVHVRRRVGEGAVLVSRFFLDLPLVALAWMLVPLAWLLAMAGLVSADRVWLMLPVAAGAGVALAAAGRSGARPATPTRIPPLARVGAAWAIVALLPAVIIRPAWGTLACGGFAVGLVAGDRWWGRRTRTERRVEPSAVLVVLALLAPWFVTTSPNLGSLTWDGGGQATRAATLLFVQVVVGYAALGFALAEHRGREVRGWRSGMMLAIVATLGLAGPLVGGASTARLALLVLAAVAGAFLYRQQRADILVLIRCAGVTSATAPP